MQKAIELIEKLIKEHEDGGYCTNYDEANNLLFDDEVIGMKFYDCGRYETLINLLNDLKRMGA